MANPTPLKEFELIERLCAKLPSSRRTILGPGDDCAIVVGSHSPQIVTIDSIVEGVHFLLEWGPPESLGARALTVNLSDIAAMGGVPTFCVVNLAIRKGLDQRFFDRLYRGLIMAAASAQIDVVGGNVTRGEQFAITIALSGEVRNGVMRRDLARPGDAIYVTGTLGDAALGLRILQGQQKARSADGKFLIARFLNPTARLKAGRAAACLKPTPAAIDISDGLWQDLGHILHRSGVGAEVESSSIPLSSAYRAVMGDDVAVALGGGEDYELLFCTRARLTDAALSRKLGLPVTRIGTILKERRMMLLRHGEIIEPPLGRAGFDHLAV